MERGDAIRVMRETLTPVPETVQGPLAMSDPLPPVDAPPPLGPVLRHYGPWIGAIVAMLGLGVTVVDLRGRVATLEERVAAAPLVQDAGPARVIDPPPPSAAGTTVTPGAPPPVWPCAGTLTEDQVRSAVGRQGSVVLACISARLADAPSLEGVLVVRMRVEQDGHVADVYVAGLEDASLVSCVGNAALGWSFDAPEGESCAVVEAPFAVGSLTH